jgi:hypothetical protein
MFIKRLGRRTHCARVSLSPSKIPYGGFSPVRLQTGSRVRPSSKRLIRTPSHAHATLSAQTGKNSQTQSQWHSSPEALGSAVGYSVPPRHSLLWPHPSLSASPTDLSINTVGLCSHSRRREGPQFILRVCTNVPSSVPRRTERLHLAVATPFVQAFAISVLARHPWYPRIPVPRGCVSRLQSSLYATACWLACPAPARAFTLELSP